jgi:hypothetical protein
VPVRRPRLLARGGPRLRVAATLWSLAQHPSAGREWTLARKVAAIKAAGFEGVQSPYRAELLPLLHQHGLALVGALDATDPAEFPRQVAELVSAGAVIANAQIGEHDTSTNQAVDLAVAVMGEARRQGLRLQIETHRDTATETPEKFQAIAEGYRRTTGERLPVTWDHSHFAVVKHLRPADFATRLLTDPELVQHSRLFHCRPFNGHHCQVPVTDRRGRLTPEFRDWLVFARALFTQWRLGASAADELWVVPEQGAAFNGYNLTGFNRPWPDAIVCARELRRLWHELEVEDRG